MPEALKLWSCATNVASVLPPVAPAAYAEPRPTTNLSTKFGAPADCAAAEPSHNTQLLGILWSVPDHIIIPPIGITPLPTKVSDVVVPPTVKSSAMFASSVDVSCSAVIVVDEVISPVTSTFPVTFCPPENVERPTTSRVSKE